MSTISSSTFNLNKFYSLLPAHITSDMLDGPFLTWFIGFFEADGSFEKDGRVNITQSTGDIQVLNKVSTMLGSGSVRSHNPAYDSKAGKQVGGTSRWRTKASDVALAARLALLFNNNIVTGSKLKSFQAWCDFWMKNPYFLKLVGPDFVVQQAARPGLMSFDNGWLSGFIDGDGHWGITLSKVKSKPNPAASIRMAVAAQGDTEWIENAIKVLNMGRRDPKTGVKNVKWTVNKQEDLEVLIRYIEKFNHKTKKAISFTKWCKLRRRVLNKEHYGNGYDKIKALSLEINKT